MVRRMCGAKWLQVATLACLSFPLSASGDIAYWSNERMAKSADVIVIGDVKAVENARSFSREQIAHLEVKSIIKGQPGKYITIKRGGFICDLTKFKTGRYLLFLSLQPKSVFEYNFLPVYASVNYDNGVREISGNEIRWLSRKLPGNQSIVKSMDFVLAEVDEINKGPWVAYGYR